MLSVLFSHKLKKIWKKCYLLTVVHMRRNEYSSQFALFVEMSIWSKIYYKEVSQNDYSNQS